MSVCCLLLTNSKQIPVGTMNKYFLNQIYSKELFGTDVIKKDITQMLYCNSGMHLQ